MGAQESTQAYGQILPPKFSWLIENKLAAHALPQRKMEFLGLQALNVRLVVTLNNQPLIPGTLVEHGPELPRDIYDLVEPSFAFLFLGCTDGGPPSMEQAIQFVRETKKVISAGGAVTVHCWAGEGRTGTVLACYFVSVDGMTSHEAIAHVRAIRPGSIHNARQEGLVHEFHAANVKAGGKLVENYTIDPQYLTAASLKALTPGASQVAATEEFVPGTETV